MISDKRRMDGVDMYEVGDKEENMIMKDDKQFTVIICD